jgi:hypothetical protein
MEEGTNKSSNGVLGAVLGGTTIGTILIVMFVGK